MNADRAVIVEGVARQPGGSPESARVILEPDGFRVVNTERTWAAAYRDIATLAIQESTVLVVLGSADDPGGERILLERFGDRTGLLVRELRERRLRQRLADAFVEVPAGPSIDMVEYRIEPADDAAGGGGPSERGGAGLEAGTAREAAAALEAGVAHVAFHPWGAVLAPLDERRAVRFVRRGDIGRVDIVPADGACRVMPRGSDVSTDHGPPSRAVDADGDIGSGFEAFELVRLGPTATALAGRFMELRDAAASDAARLVGSLAADAPYGIRAAATARLVDGRPVSPESVGAETFSTMEAAFLTEPTFAQSHRGLLNRAGADAPRWLAMAPSTPGADEPRTWTFVGLPGNLVALELLSAGAHATYCFRVAPRATYAGGLDHAALASTVALISRALVDARFLREPMALPDDRLAAPAYLRYRLALAALPSLSAARARFVARIVHSDADRWEAALDDLIRWHGSTRDDEAIWPGRAAQETAIEAAAHEEAAGVRAEPSDRSSDEMPLPPTP